MTQTPIICDGVSLFLIEEEGLLFSEPQQKIYSLNTMAAVIWVLIEDRQTTDQISNHLCDTYDMDRTTAQTYVSDVITNWRALKVLDTDEIQTRDEGKKASDRSHFPALPPEETRPNTLQLKLLSQVIELRFENTETAALMHQVIVHLLTDGSAQPTIVIDVFQSDGRFYLYVDQEPGLECEALDQLAPIVKAAVWSMSVGKEDFFLDIHAGVAANEKACVILPGKAGSGKSSLTTALVHSGLTYFSDEIALIDEDFRVMPAPLAFCIKSTGWDLMKPYLPHLEEQPVHRRADNKVVRYVPPLQDSMPNPGARLPIHAIIFPTYSPDAQTQLQPLTKTATLHRLLEECQAVPAQLTNARMHALIGWISSVAGFELPMSDLKTAVEQVNHILS